MQFPSKFQDLHGKEMDKISQETSMEEKLVPEQRAEKLDLPDIRSYFKVKTINTVDLAVEKRVQKETYTYKKT